MNFTIKNWVKHAHNLSFDTRTEHTWVNGTKFTWSLKYRTNLFPEASIKSEMNSKKKFRKSIRLVPWKKFFYHMWQFSRKQTGKSWIKTDCSNLFRIEIKALESRNMRYLPDVIHGNQRWTLSRSSGATFNFVFVLKVFLKMTSLFSADSSFASSNLKESRDPSMMLQVKDEWWIIKIALKKYSCVLLTVCRAYSGCVGKLVINYVYHCSL